MYKVMKVKQKGKDRWVVITPDNLIANEVRHSTEKEADKHAMYLNAFFVKGVDIDED